MDIAYKCNSCGWTGNENELDWELVDSCAGADKIEVCPNCGSMDVRMIQKK